MAVDGVPSSESRWISLRATVFPVSRSLPLNTVAYVLLTLAMDFRGCTPLRVFLAVGNSYPPFTCQTGKEMK
jgi:hypothetical protein